MGECYEPPEGAHTSSALPGLRFRDLPSILPRPDFNQTWELQREAFSRARVLLNLVWPSVCCLTPCESSMIAATNLPDSTEILSIYGRS